MLFSFIVLAFRGFPPWEVISGRSLRYSVRFGRALRGKFGKTADDTDVTDGFLDWRLTQTHYNWMPDWARWVRQPPGALPVSYLRYPCKSGACHAGGSAEAGKIISASPRRVSGNAGRSAKDPRLDRALEAPG